jgi:hypothetical protein
MADAPDLGSDPKVLAPSTIVHSCPQTSDIPRHFRIAWISGKDTLLAGAQQFSQSSAKVKRIRKGIALWKSHK